MRLILFLILLGGCTTEVVPPPKKVSYMTPKVDRVHQFIEAVIHVESRGNVRAYNESEDAVGCLQIRPIMVREVNRQLKKIGSNKRYTLTDRWDRYKSIEMFNVMANVVKRTDEMTFMEWAERVARRWNGGGRGYYKESTKEYWERVKIKLNSTSRV